MTKSILKSILFLIYFFNIAFAQSTPASTVLNSFNLTTTCKTSITSLVNNKNINECLPMFTILASISPFLPSTQERPEAKLNTLAQLIKQTCSLPKCSSSLTQNTALTLKQDCSQDLLQQNIMATLNFLLFSHYKPIRELTCKRNSTSQFNSYCILETLTNIGSYNAKSATLNKRHFGDINSTTTLEIPTITLTPGIPTTTLTPVNAKNNDKIPSQGTVNAKDNKTPKTPKTPSQDSSSISKTLETLPNSLICTDCNKAMVSVVKNYLIENPTALNGTQIQPTMILQATKALELKCGGSFLDGTTPKLISSSSKLLHSYLGIFIITTLLLL